MRIPAKGKGTVGKKVVVPFEAESLLRDDSSILILQWPLRSSRAFKVFFFGLNDVTAATLLLSSRNRASST